MDNILEVKNLKIAFRTTAGTLKAVRDISFDLKRGKTLAIVGESGSGKSVTSRAVMGILAGNSIVEGGEILYDGKDLLHIQEEDMQKIRGDKISMIFQDPLSSLNPIVKIGPQITEAMLLKSKTSRREAKRDFNKILGVLKEKMKKAASDGEQEKIDGMIRDFGRFISKGTEMEGKYNASMERVQAAASMIDDLLFKVGKTNVDLSAAYKKIRDQLKKATDPFALNGVEQAVADARDALGRLPGGKLDAGKNVALEENSEKKLQEIRSLLGGMMSRTQPDFSALGYYALHHGQEKPESANVGQMNETARKAMENGFMQEFYALMDKGVSYSAKQAEARQKEILPLLDAAAEAYGREFTKSEAKKRCKALSKQVNGCIDQLEIVKDSVAYTFSSRLNGAIDRYFEVKAHNPREEKRFARQSARRERMIRRGRTVTWKVVPKNVYDLDELKDGIVSINTHLKEKYQANVEKTEALDVHARSVEIVEYMKKKASQMVAHVTKTMARERALQLMEEVGINNPRQRFSQYPFEFSGGMRQRIVIAIALAADPDILICDEPTTALDVTIQAQILELINKLKAERNLSIIFITHDLGVVANMADDIAVMYAGKIVEYGTVEEVFYQPAHPYTWALLASMPDLETKEKLEAIPGTPPSMIYPPKGDAFADRNRYAMQIDFEQQPPAFQISDTHWAATWLLHPDAPKAEPPKAVTERIAKMKARLEEQAHA